jgi:hypothetical protein
MTSVVLSEPWMKFELTTLVVIGTDSCKSNRKKYVPYKQARIQDLWLGGRE